MWIKVDKAKKNPRPMAIYTKRHWWNKWVECNTLEVKEVDIDKEIDLVEDKYHGFESLSRADIINVAKHFFELGMKMAQKTIK